MKKNHNKSRESKQLGQKSNLEGLKPVSVGRFTRHHRNIKGASFARSSKKNFFSVTTHQEKKEALMIISEDEKKKEVRQDKRGIQSVTQRTYTLGQGIPTNHNCVWIKYYWMINVQRFETHKKYNNILQQELIFLKKRVYMCVYIFIYFLASDAFFSSEVCCVSFSSKICKTIIIDKHWIYGCTFFALENFFKFCCQWIELKLIFVCRLSSTRLLTRSPFYLKAHVSHTR